MYSAINSTAKAIPLFVRAEGGLCPSYSTIGLNGGPFRDRVEYDKTCFKNNFKHSCTLTEHSCN